MDLKFIKFKKKRLISSRIYKACYVAFLSMSFEIYKTLSSTWESLVTESAPI